MDSDPFAFPTLPAIQDLLRLFGCAHVQLQSLAGPPPLPEYTTADIVKAFQSPVWPSGDLTRPMNRPVDAWSTIAPGETVCIVVCDQTRKAATDRILPILLQGAGERGCDPRDWHILFASGIHRHPTDAEARLILGDTVFASFAGRMHRHDPDTPAGLATVGHTRRGQAVRINRRAVECDRLILIGAALYHYHAGFGGGRKMLVPGVAARDTIAHNHSLTLDPDADRLLPTVGPGVLDGNPVAEEMLESARLCEPDLLINTVLDPDGRLVGVFTGDLDLAHRAACRLAEQVFRIDLHAAYDLVVASAGGAPDWVQSHKALYSASRVVRPDGRIILFAPCPEGLGGERFRHWLTRPTIEQLYRELRASREVNGQTALSTRLRGGQTILITGLNAGDRADLGVATAPDLAAALRMALGARNPRDRALRVALFAQADRLLPFRPDEARLK